MPDKNALLKAGLRLIALICKMYLVLMYWFLLQFMEKMRQEYSEAAREAGVLLVSSCGFDSIPNDLGALYVQRQFHGELAYLDSYVTTTAVRFT